MEEDLWSKLMIAPLYNNALDGDVQMRQQWLTITNRYSTALHCTALYHRVVVMNTRYAVNFTHLTHYTQHRYSSLQLCERLFLCLTLHLPEPHFAHAHRLTHNMHHLALLPLMRRPPLTPTFPLSTIHGPEQSRRTLRLLLILGAALVCPCTCSTRNGRPSRRSLVSICQHLN
jgi:hypothetical protein